MSDVDWGNLHCLDRRQAWRYLILVPGLDLAKLRHDAAHRVFLKRSKVAAGRQPHVVMHGGKA